MWQAVSQHPRVVQLKNKVDLGVYEGEDLACQGQVLSRFLCASSDASRVDGFKDFLYELCMSSVESDDLEWLCTLRQQQCVQALCKHVDDALHSSKQGQYDDCLAIDLKAAIEQCSELTGDAITEEMLDGVFSRFCVGK